MAKEYLIVVTPVPGGVEPMTVYSLIENILSTSIYNNLE